MIRVAIADDHPHVYIALKSLLQDVPDIQLIAESRSGVEVVRLVRKFLPDVLFLDLIIEPEFDALSTVRTLRMEFPALKICILSAFLDPIVVQDLLKAGVYGYILKDDDFTSRIESIIREMIEGEIYLSPQAYKALAQATRAKGQEQILTEREIDILRLAKRGLQNIQIAQSLNITAGTVRNHLSTAYRKLNVHSLYEALQIAEERKIV